MANDHRRPHKWVFSHAHDAGDLIELERRIETLEAKRAAVEKKICLVPGRKKARLAQIDNVLGTLRWNAVSVREEINASLTQGQAYEERVEHERDSKTATVVVSARWAAALKLAEVERMASDVKRAKDGPAITSGTIPELTPEMRRATFRSFLEQRKDTSHVEQQVAQAKLLENEREPEA